MGVTPEFAALRRLQVGRGRFLPETELDRGGALAVLGHGVARELFGGEDPIGAAVRIGGRRCKVIGVLASRGQQLGMNMDEVAMVPVATGMRMFNRSSLFPHRDRRRCRPATSMRSRSARARCWSSATARRT